MPKRNDVDIQIDHIHSRAICDEIADRLRDILQRDVAELPAYLKHLVERLAESDGQVVLSSTLPESATSIAPSFEDMMPRRELITLHDEDAPA
jgi:hypothetical protein